jgi:hypothetical protein
MTGTAIRLLAPTEDVFVLPGVVIAYSVRVRGELDISILSSAYEILQRSYPALAAHLEVVDAGHMIVEQSESLRGVSVSDGHIDFPLVGAKLDRGVLSGLHVVRDGDQANVTLLIHHCIADSRHSLSVLDDLWSLYTDLAQGKPGDIVPHDYPDSLEKLLADSGISEPHRDGAPPPPAAVVLARHSPVSDKDGHPVETDPTIRCLLSTDCTAALVEFGHRHALTINGLVSAAILRAEAEVRNVPVEGVPYLYFVDLRKRLTPPVAGTAGTNVLSYASFTAARSTAGLSDLARMINEELQSELADCTIHRAGWQLPEVIKTSPENLATNWGRVPSLHSPAGLEIEDFRGMFCRLRRAYGVPSRRLPQQTQFFVVTTFRGRLSVELRVRSPAYLDAARERMAAVEHQLQSVV